MSDCHMECFLIPSSAFLLKLKPTIFIMLFIFQVNYLSRAQLNDLIQVSEIHFHPRDIGLENECTFIVHSGASTSLTVMPKCK